MSERLLEAFREEAERVTPVPAFDLIEVAGRRRRRRRYAVGATVAACIVGVGGFLAQPDADSSGPHPVDDRDPSSLATPWPGPTMTTLPEGTYEFASSVGPGSPAVRLTLPPGWNAWEGPNRFEGMGYRVTDDARVNERLLSRDPSWYADLLLLDAEWIAARGCTMSDVRDSDPAGLVQALIRAPGLEVVDGPSSTTRAGRDEVRLRLRVHESGSGCLRRYLLQARQGVIDLGEVGETHDARVIDVDGQALLVWASWSRHTPSAEVGTLLGIAASVDIQ